MIPTLILLGMICGRWWRSSLVAAAVGWPTLLVAADVMSVSAGLLGASALATVNAAVGVAIHQMVWRITRQLRRSGSSRSAA
ncbi:hypothetical protein [Cryptosporangium japonicum]|uniref:Uncharacterized protein n=1 Tax=Cryptosporangium japonicum TaxID=80872 RepID=A0ABP3DXF6_9ACTN